MKITLLLVDDHEVLRGGLKVLFKRQPDLEVVGEAASGAEAMTLAASLKPSVIIMDLHLGRDNGIEITRQILSRNPRIKVIILSAYGDDDSVSKAIETGVSGYVLKSNAAEDIVKAIRTVLDDKVFLSPDVAKSLVETYKGFIASAGASEGNGLSEREVEVLRLIAEGLRTKEIADRLKLSGKTVDAHRSHLMKKLKCDSAVQLARYAIRKGICPP